MRMDKIRNVRFREVLNTKPVIGVIEEGQLRWLGHVHRMQQETMPRSMF